jgi:hypothetical protein
MIDEHWKSLQELDSTAHEEYRRRSSQANKNKETLEEKCKTKTKKKGNPTKKLKKKENEPLSVSLGNLQLSDEVTPIEEETTVTVVSRSLLFPIHSPLPLTLSFPCSL